MNVEDLLRETVAPRAGSDPAAEERVRREAMAALTGMRRRHRVRRVLSVAAATAGVAAIAGFFVFAMPRGGEDSSGAGRATAPTVPVALLTRPARPVDRLSGGVERLGVDPAPQTLRYAGSGERLRFYAALLANGRLCVLATTRTGGRPRGATCNDPAVLTHVGVLTFERGRAEAGPDGRVIFDRAFLVPDGIRAVVAGGRRIAVRANLAVESAASWEPNPAVTLVGPAARSVRPETGPDWPRGSSGGMPTVTVPVSMGSVRSARPTPIGAVRLVAPSAAPAGSVIDLRIVGLDGLLGENVTYGVDAYLERRAAAGWRPFYGLYVGTPEQGSPGPPVLLGPDGFAVTGIGLMGAGPRPVRLPDVPPGTYRISRSVIDSSSGSPVNRTLTAEIRITAG